MTRNAAGTALLALLLAMVPRSAAPQDLDAAVAQFTAAWARGDVSALTAAAARGGVSLDVDGTPVGPIGTRQASAVLRRVFDGRETVDVRAGMAHVTGGSPASAFAEIAWTNRARGTTIPARNTVFVAYVREDGRWRVTQIRLR
jgi:ketosteroid isomerase-like protein